MNRSVRILLVIAGVLGLLGVLCCAGLFMSLRPLASDFSEVSRAGEAFVQALVSERWEDLEDSIHSQAKGNVNPSAIRSLYESVTKAAGKPTGWVLKEIFSRHKNFVHYWELTYSLSTDKGHSIELYMELEKETDTWKVRAVRIVANL